ncbi:hypothetical protein ANO14919_108370 [Xylariales sp. No.14919]|nr:hypothetical protein ANO14919_108370 [Xylariales sp. No.14919]
MLPYFGFITCSWIGSGGDGKVELKVAFEVMGSTRSSPKGE